MKTAKEIFVALIETMEADNGCEFDATLAQHLQGERAVAEMITRGWNPDGLTAGLEPGYQNDIDAFAAGEHSDVQKIIAAYDGQELSDLLNDIFDHG